MTPREAAVALAALARQVRETDPDAAASPRPGILARLAAWWRSWRRPSPPRRRTLPTDPWVKAGRWAPLPDDELNALPRPRTRRAGGDDPLLSPRDRWRI